MRSAERNERGDVLKPSRLRQDFGAAGKALCGMEELKAQRSKLKAEGLEWPFFVFLCFSCFRDNFSYSFTLGTIGHSRHFSC